MCSQVSSLSQDNDAEAESIAKEGQRLARELLQPHRLYCYYYLVLQVNISLLKPSMHLLYHTILSVNFKDQDATVQFYMKVTRCHSLLSQTYASRQLGQPTVHPDMELVPQPSDHSSVCSCQRGAQASRASSRKDEL